MTLCVVVIARNEAIQKLNTTGPCNPDKHYMLPPEDRLVGAQLYRYMIDNTTPVILNAAMH